MTLGRPPVPLTAYGLPDNQWLLGLAGGLNWNSRSGLVALAGGGQAGATIIGVPDANGNAPFLVEFDTVATGADSAQLPFAQPGQGFLIRNAGAQSMRVFANPGTNKVTGAADSINGGANATGVDIAANHGAIVFCAKAGVWTMLVV